MSDLVEKCLRIMHGHTSWSVIKNQWPESAVSEQRRKMEEAIREVRSDAAVETRRLGGCLLAIAGAEGCGNGALRAAAYEAAVKGASPGELAAKLKLPATLRSEG